MSEAAAVHQVDSTRSIEARFEGPDIGSGWVPVPHLLSVLGGLQSAITIVMEDLWGRAHTRGPVPAEIQRPATFMLGQVRAGSFTATLELERPPADQAELFDLQPAAVQRLVVGIGAIAAGGASDLPIAAAQLLASVTEKIRRSPNSLRLKGGGEREVLLSAATIAPAEPGTSESQRRKLRLRGRLLEIDYRDRSAEIWEPSGRMTTIRFREDQRGAVDAVRQQHVTVEGDVSRTGRVDLDWIEASEISDSFWNSRSLNDLSLAPGASPAAPGTPTTQFWIEDDQDDFLATLGRWRQEA